MLVLYRGYFHRWYTDLTLLQFKKQIRVSVWKYSRVLSPYNTGHDIKYHPDYEAFGILITVQANI